MNNTYTMDGYFEEYRRKVQEHRDLLELIDQTKTDYNATISELRNKHEKMINEINDMRVVITSMIDNGLDPVAARLTIEQSKESMWSNINSKGYEFIEVDTGAMGAMGSTAGITLPPGTNGPGGPKAPYPYDNTIIYSR